MNKHVIERGHWTEFLNGYSDENAGRRASIRLDGFASGSQTEAQNVPFRGISAEVRPGREAVTITVGEDRSELTRIIENPREIAILEDDQGNEVGLAIQEPQGEVTSLLFSKDSTMEVGR